MPLFIAFWLIANGIIVYRSVKDDHVPPGPGQMLITSGPFMLLALLATGGRGPRALATAIAGGLDLAAAMNLFGPATAAKKGHPAVFPRAGCAGNVQIFPDGGAGGAALAAAASTGTSTGTGGGTAPTSGSLTQMLTQLAVQFGWDASQVSAWVNVLNAESGGNPNATNPQSGAYGAAQALGHGTTGSAGCGRNEYGANFGLTTAQAQQANCGNLGDQLLWMANYIKQTYGTPAAAWAHEQSAHWY